MNLTGISSNITDSACAFSKYLECLLKMDYVSQDIMKETNELKRQFNSCFKTYGCSNNTSMLDKRINDGNFYNKKCLGLDVLRNLASWLKVNKQHKCVGKH